MVKNCPFIGHRIFLATSRKFDDAQRLCRLQIVGPTYSRKLAFSEK